MSECISENEVDVAESGESVLNVAVRMRQRGVGCLVVVNTAYEPIGIVTDRDLVVRVLAEGMDAARTRIDDVMTVQPETALDETPLEEALGLMRRGAFRRLPIVSPKGKLKGILTLDDILTKLTKEFTQVDQVLQRESPRVVASE
jgi:CBS domain-containing protein